MLSGAAKRLRDLRRGRASGGETVPVSAWDLARCYVSHEHRFVYVETPKVGCTIVKATLLELFPELPESDSPAVSRAHTALENPEHRITKRELARCRENGEYRDYLCFSFVRNPWDRLLSCYRSKIRADGIALNRTEYEGGTLYPGMGFREFAEVACRTPDEDANMHFRAQTPMLAGPAGGLLVDYVGRFESLPRDFAEVCDRIGAPLRLPPATKARREDYRASYDDELRKLVGARYRADAERFGYSFR